MGGGDGAEAGAGGSGDGRPGEAGSGQRGPGGSARPPVPAVDPASLAGVLGGGLTARLDRWAAEARVDEAARRRSRERWLRQQAEEESSLAGVLVDLAERGAVVTVHARGDRRHGGTIRAVGHDFTVVASAAAETIVALWAVTAVRTGPGEAAALGDRAVATTLRLADVLGGLAAERARALLVTGDGGGTVAGTLRSVGHDVVVMRCEGAPPATAYVPLTAITEVVLGS
jgi:hypothetical protein